MSAALPWDRIRDLFSEAADLPRHEQRDFVKRESGGDAAIENEVLVLLDSDADTPPSKWTGFLEAAKFGPARGRFENLVGKTIGPYTLTGVIGRGGASIVYLGERNDRKYFARVAIKLVDQESSDSLIAARFAAERQILAQLNHINIARLLDAGESEEGFPFIIMEYVQGWPLDKFCDEQRLSIEDRLRLFTRVCDAVSCAHRNLIVHRDLKPTNILVTQDGTPKLLDFGIAKLIEPEKPTFLTKYKDRALTPEYASPEQIEGRPVATATDVYSLGVILYELLCGLAPYEVSSASRAEIERAICLCDPVKPSQKLAANTTNDELSVGLRSASSRATQPERLQAKLRGDLDAIVMRALRKEPDKRYPSVAALSEDIARFLETKPVEARRGNWFYHVDRFVRRHAVPVALGVTVVSATLIFAISSSQLHRQAVRDRDSVARIANLLGGIFSDANPMVANGQTVTAVDLLEYGTARINEIKDISGPKAQLLRQMGEANLNLGRYQQAAELLSEAISIDRSIDDKAQLAQSLAALASAKVKQGDMAVAIEFNRQAREVLLNGGLKGSVVYGQVIRSIGKTQHTLGNISAARASYEEALAVFRQRNASFEVALTLGKLASLYSWSNELVAAEHAATEALLLLEPLPDSHPAKVFTQVTLGDILTQLGELDRAADLLEKAVKIQRMTYANNGPKLLDGIRRLAELRVKQARPDLAEPLFAEMLSIAERSLGSGHFQVGLKLTQLGKFLVGEGRYAEAANYLRRAVRVLSGALPSNHPYLSSAQYWLGESLLGVGKFDEAIRVLTPAREHQSRQSPRWFFARTESALGQSLVMRGELNLGRKYLRDSYETLLADRGSEDQATSIALSRLRSLGVDLDRHH